MQEYSAVFWFTHRLDRIEEEFVQVITTGGHEILLSKGHYIYVGGDLVPASEVQIGSVLTLGTGENSKVAFVGLRKAVGLFNPQTESGDIVVNGILVSTYTTSVAPQLAHALLSPARALYATFGPPPADLNRGASSQLANNLLGILPPGASLI